MAAQPRSRAEDSHSKSGAYRCELCRRLCLVVEVPVVVAAPCPPVLPDVMLSPVEVPLVELLAPPIPLVLLPVELPPDVELVVPLVPEPIVPEPVAPVPD
jgi:hypothetical protein